MPRQLSTPHSARSHAGAGIAEGMVEYVTLAVLALHRDLLPFIAQQARRLGAKSAAPRQGTARRNHGLGMLGQAVLDRSNISVSRWRAGTGRRVRLKVSAVYAARRPCPSSSRRRILVCLLH